MALGEVGCGGMDWIGLAEQVQVEGSYESNNEPMGSIKCSKFSGGCTSGHLLSHAQLHNRVC
jgi:hypothetical protein